MTQEQALQLLKTGANVFLTGEPGSGKTHTVNEYVGWLKKHGIQPAITASTGIAATHINGMTIHSFSGIGIADYLSEYDIEMIAGREKIMKRILATSVLIIDEVSMLDGARLSMVDSICRSVKQIDLPFGGIQIVLVGDFFQLPPVTNNKNQTAFAFESKSWQTLKPLVCYLTEQHRQEDSIFLELLSAIRRNSVHEGHHERILGRLGNLSGAPKEIPRLFSHNRDVDAINAQELAKLPGNGSKFLMSSKGRKPLVEQLQRGCLSPEILELKKDAIVMFTKNSPTGRFVNGTLGIVAGIDEKVGYPIVKLRNGQKIVVEPMKWAIEDGGRELASIQQIPLRLAWAMTVHKSQGMSMDAAVMDLSQTFEFGQGYVALSRVRRLDGVHLLGINEKALMVHPQILAQDNEFRTASETAEASLAELAAELQSLHEKFIKASGGSIKEKAIEKTGFDKIRETHPNAYRPWDEQQDAELQKLFVKDLSISKLAEIFGRKPGGIRSRLVKLGLIEV